MKINAPRVAALLVVMFALLAGSAMLRTSTTFDEIVFPAVGARGLHNGDFSMVNDHPRLAQYLYGAPLVLGAVALPPEGYDWRAHTRYQYAEMLYWDSGNSGDRVAVLARLAALTLGSLTVLATFLLARRHMPAGAALFAAGLVAFTPDVLAHSGVSYNDVPVALGILLGVYALDAMVRKPGPRTALLAAAAFVFAAGVKYSGLILVPAAFALLALEACGRWRDARWRVAMLRAVALFVVASCLALALIYRGDWLLREYMAGIGEMSGPALTRGHTAYLLGERRTGGWWYYFPVALALKTSAGFHVLVALAASAAVLASRAGAWREWVVHRARAPAIAALLMLGVMITARMNIGTRHALPMVVPACILVAQGAAWWWARGARVVRVVTMAAFAVMVASALRYYPYFLSYLSEYVYGRPSYEILVDSATDWGHGLVGLREYMRANGIDHVALGYFGTAMPQGYGIRFTPMPSYFMLADDVAADPPPRYLVVSATLLAGSYLARDPYAALRREKPVAVVGGSLYVFDLMAMKKN